MDFNPRNWYWIVDGAGPHLPDGGRHSPHTKVYSSAAGRYLSTGDSRYETWCEDLLRVTGVAQPATRIATEEELADVLRQYGLKVGEPAK